MLLDQLSDPIRRCPPYPDYRLIRQFINVFEGLSLIDFLMRLTQRGEVSEQDPLQDRTLEPDGEASSRKYCRQAPH
jgi:hypothetical protein